MADLNYDVSVNTTGAIKELDKLDKGVGKLNSAFGALRSALAGIAFGTFINDLARTAQTLTDLSTTTGIATTTLLGMQQAFQFNGSSAEDADKAILKLMQSVSDAATTSLTMRDSFEQVGVSLRDLQTLSEEEIFRKVLQGLSQIKDRSLQAALAQEILGKSVRTLDFAGASGDIDTYAAANVNVAKGIKTLDETAKRLEQTIAEIKNAVLGFIGVIYDNAAAIKYWGSIIFEFGKYLVLLIFPWGRILNGVKLLWAALTGFFGSIINGIKAIYTFGVSVGQLIRVLMNPLQRSALLQNLRLLPTLASKIGSVFAAMTGYIKEAAAAVVAFVATALGITNLINKIDSISSERKLAEMNKASMEYHAQSNRAAEEAARKLKAEQEQRREVIDLLIKQRQSIQQVTDSYLDQNNKIIENINLETSFQNLSKNGQEIAKAQNDIYNRAIDAITSLQEKKAALKEEEKSLGNEIDRQIALIEKSILADQIRVESALKGLQDYQAAQLALGRSIEYIGELNREAFEIQKLQEQISLIGLYGDELENQQVLLEITQDLKQKLLEIDIRQLELIKDRISLGEEEFQKQMEYLDALREKAYEYAGARVDAENEVLEKTREAQKDWQGALKQQLEELADSVTPAKTAVDLFGSVIGSIDNAITEFVKNGKFNFKEFAKSILRDMAVIIARAIIMRAILGAVGMIFPGATTGMSALLNATPMRAGGSVSASNPYLVGEAGPELFIPRSAGTIVPNNQLAMAGMGGNNVTYNINAVDAQSFRSLVARDPQFIYNVTEVGRRSQPNRRLA